MRIVKDETKQITLHDLRIKLIQRSIVMDVDKNFIVVTDRHDYKHVIRGLSVPDSGDLTDKSLVWDSGRYLVSFWDESTEILPCIEKLIEHLEFQLNDGTIKSVELIGTWDELKKIMQNNP